jgi:hypothetical protein
VPYRSPAMVAKMAETLDRAVRGRPRTSCQRVDLDPGQVASLEGPLPEEEPEMRRLGWDPRAAFQVTERRAQQEFDQVARFDDDPEWRGRRIRDVMAARELLIEINESLFRALSEGVYHPRVGVSPTRRDSPRHEVYAELRRGGDDQDCLPPRPVAPMDDK